MHKLHLQRMMSSSKSMLRGGMEIDVDKVVPSFLICETAPAHVAEIRRIRVTVVHKAERFIEKIVPVGHGAACRHRRRCRQIHGRLARSAPAGIRLPVLAMPRIIELENTIGDFAPCGVDRNLQSSQCPGICDDDAAKETSGKTRKQGSHGHPSRQKTPEAACASDH
jgi:hypothetical protein